MRLFRHIAVGAVARGIPQADGSRTDSSRHHGIADRFVTTMTGIYEQLERRAVTPAAKDAAHQLKTDLALGAVSNAVNSRPIAGLMDMVVLVTLLGQIAEDPWAVQTFGHDS